MITARAWLLVLGATLALSGCRSYAPRPLDLSAHHKAWLARSPSDAGVAEFARRLAEGHSSGGSGFNLADGVSLNEGEAIALFFNAQLRMARLRASAARASAEFAGLWDDPELGFDAERILKGVEHPWVVGGTLGLTIPISGRLGAQRALAEAGHERELQRVLEQEWNTRIALRSVWLEWSAQSHRRALARDLSGRFESVLEVVAQLEGAGELSQMEARLFRIEAAARAAGLRGLEARDRQLQFQLRALMGLAPSAPLELAPAPLVGASNGADDSAFLESIGQRSPTLATLRAEYEAAERALRLEVRRQYPDLTIGPGLGAEDGDTRVLLGASIPVPLWNRNRRAIAEAGAQREIARAAYETEFERLSHEIAMAQVERDSAAAQRVALETGLVPLVEEQDAQARRVAELGEVDTLLLLENLTRLYDTKSALIDARLAEALASVRLDALMGPPMAAHTKEVRVELVGFAGCHNTPAMTQRLAESLAALGLEMEVEFVDQHGLPGGDARLGYASPTVLVDGEDLFGLPASSDAAMSCRVYAGTDGVPSTSDILRALRGVIGRTPIVPDSPHSPGGNP